MRPITETSIDGAHPPLKCFVTFRLRPGVTVDEFVTWFQTENLNAAAAVTAISNYRVWLEGASLGCHLTPTGVRYAPEHPVPRGVETLAELAHVNVDQLAAAHARLAAYEDGVDVAGTRLEEDVVERRAAAEPEHTGREDRHIRELAGNKAADLAVEPEDLRGLDRAELEHAPGVEGGRPARAARQTALQAVSLRSDEAIDCIGDAQLGEQVTVDSARDIDPEPDGHVMLKRAAADG